ncbi:TIGR03364 family FAD-dependent oxidoreductase [Mycetocola zhadangensis]|uniref:TIGR03364 family FAD-dependent oxidoreductase n=1 Tax=Mycetocola zhadangensis TaxID=1164595 RepID=A0A3L7J7M2_9MICO|nr:TIGR03364 family FAD-dependent oxidoreductase [Mycetocola zhadangensis]RLQ84502.1 TIGR03364 family FAD-dependent oxidoreductase [Mycetocola zhadangensis]GGE92405.1 oxidoreductase [Mycetocola zhadangensis]
MRAQYDVAIVGSGIVGLGAALAATRRGLSVIVIDRSAEILGASVRNFGHLCFTPQSGIARTFAAASRELWLQLAVDAKLEVRRTGTFVVARHLDELEVLGDLAARRAGSQALSSGSEQPEVELLTSAEIEGRVPVAPGSTVGGAHLGLDLQVNPRDAVHTIAAHLAERGVEFLPRTAVTAVRSGRVETTRGIIHAGIVVVAVNADIDQLYPDVAERVGIRRCGLDMLRVNAGLRFPLAGPLLTGWSLLRYSAFTRFPAAGRIRERLHAQHPYLAALDLNQMYTQQPDGSLIVGDTHYRGDAIAPFQDERAAAALLDITAELFGTPRPRVLERWQGVYASGPDEYLIEQVEPGVHLAAATTGIGMTTGLGLAEHVVEFALSSATFSSPSLTQQKEFS